MLEFTANNLVVSVHRITTDKEIQIGAALHGFGFMDGASLIKKEKDRTIISLISLGVEYTVELENPKRIGLKDFLSARFR
jgi:hypothetical protein